VHCAACHGPGGSGQADLFPDLTDAHWQWGGAPEAIAQTIESGRSGVMPPLAGTLDANELDAMTDFVIALGEGRTEAEAGAAADEFTTPRTRFAAICAACHAADASGNPAIGAPDLTTGVYTYGNGFDAIRQTIAAGRQGQMPAFGDRLDRTQIKLLTVWLRSHAGTAE
jgi:cytochrome c oxidase cbb3-type subunit 3